jgi:ech hydrogenase subunit A
MFLAPFGMLISKWACIEALVISSPILAIVLAFGSAPTLFFWAKWMGKIASVPLVEKKPFGSVHFDEWSALGTLTLGTVIACGLFPWIAKASIEPYIQSLYFNTTTMTSGNIIIMLIILGLMVLLPISFLLYPRKIDKSSVYLAGANMQDNASFMGSMGIQRNVTLQNYYLTTFMTEQQLTQISVITTILTIIGMFAVLWK